MLDGFHGIEYQLNNITLPNCNIYRLWTIDVIIEEHFVWCGLLDVLHASSVMTVRRRVVKFTPKNNRLEWLDRVRQFDQSKLSRQESNIEQLVFSRAPYTQSDEFEHLFPRFGRSTLSLGLARVTLYRSPAPIIHKCAQAAVEMKAYEAVEWNISVFLKHWKRNKPRAIKLSLTHVFLAVLPGQEHSL